MLKCAVFCVLYFECCLISLPSGRDDLMDKDGDKIMSAINTLQSALNSNFLIDEKIMSLRDPDIEKLKAALAKIDNLHADLLEAMSVSKVEPGLVGSITIRLSSILGLNSG